MKRTILSGLLLSLIAPISGPADPARAGRVAGIFGDHMVLQRGVPIPVWGWANPGARVVVNLAGKAASGTADQGGRWTVKLPAIRQAGGPYDMHVSGGAAATFKDVLVGDVWLCGGQSNMEWRVNSCNAPEDMQNARFPLIRCLRIAKKSANAPLKDTQATWQVCGPATVGEFTAVGYFFARAVHQETKVPIGLIDVSWSATAIEPWIALEALKTVPELAGLHDEAARQMAAWAGPDQHPFAWSVLYNGLVAPVAPCAIKGALWYQGEGNGGEGDSYYHKMRALIGGWRQAFGVGDFPFYFVQLAAFQPPTDDPAGLDGWGWARCRMAQTKTLQIANTGMAVTIDIGDAVDIHPKNKQDVGRRLALWALAKDYGKKSVVFSGPLYRQMAVEKDRIRLTFDSVGSGLMVGKKDGLAPTAEVKGGKLQRFAIAGADRKWAWANAEIDGKSVVVWSEQVPDPVAVRYAFSMNPQGANFYNKEGLPASPFRTDDW